MAEKKTPIAADARYRRAEKVAWRDVAGEVLVIHPARSMMYPLNPVASAIWGLLDGTRDARALAGEVGRSFEVDEAKALRDVLDFLRDLSESGLVEAVRE